MFYKCCCILSKRKKRKKKEKKKRASIKAGRFRLRWLIEIVNF